MKLNKYIFLLPSAVVKVSRRYEVPELSFHDLFVLYAVAYLPEGIRQISIVRHAKRMGHPISQGSISESLSLLSAADLVHVHDMRISLAPLGREYLSAIRRYLLNKRL